MPLGTLQDHLYGVKNKEFFLDWGARLDVALSCAKELKYLHSCNPRLGHCGFNSNNILFNDKLEAKFLYSGDFWKDLDVYSFGSVLLDLICAQPSITQQVFSNNFHLQEWAIDILREGKIEEIVDPLLRGQYNRASIKTVAELALRCVARFINDQPTMKIVVQVLREAIKLEQNNIPHRRRIDNK